VLVVFDCWLVVQSVVRSIVRPDVQTVVALSNASSVECTERPSKNKPYAVTMRDALVYERSGTYEIVIV
jgi:hypothetical protein